MAVSQSTRARRIRRAWRDAVLRGGSAVLSIVRNSFAPEAGLTRRFSERPFAGDKVMQIENDYDKEVYNGDIGYIDDVDPEAGELVASFDGCSVTHGFGELDTLVPAYAATIHKSQGSEYPAVISVLTQHYPCCSEISSTPASRAASGPWFSSVRRGHRDRCSQRIGSATMLEARRVA